jgi:hypothetical protein
MVLRNDLHKSSIGRQLSAQIWRTQLDDERSGQWVVCFFFATSDGHVCAWPIRQIREQMPTNYCTESGKKLHYFRKLSQEKSQFLEDETRWNKRTRPSHLASETTNNLTTNLTKQNNYSPDSLCDDLPISKVIKFEKWTLCQPVHSSEGWWAKATNSATIRNTTISHGREIVWAGCWL